jgi:Na+-transporting methylmalonyl-CoA/oxaloacetate decarboxylase beta subunit
MMIIIGGADGAVAVVLRFIVLCGILPIIVAAFLFFAFVPLRTMFVRVVLAWRIWPKYQRRRRMRRRWCHTCCERQKSESFNT